jgi:cytochrome c oxidase cbb3-type subunit 3
VRDSSADEDDGGGQEVISRILAASLLTAMLLPTAFSQDTEDLVEKVSTQPAIRGGATYKSYCALCHGERGDGNGRGARLHVDMDLQIHKQTPDFYQQIIHGGGAAVGRSVYMPSWQFELSDEQIGDIIAYLDIVNDQVRRGEVVYKSNCIVCHGVHADGRGRAARMYDPPPANLTLSNKNDAYKSDIIRLGSAQMGRSKTMPPWGDHLSDIEMQDLLAYLRSIALVAPR